MESNSSDPATADAQVATPAKSMFGGVPKQRVRLVSWVVGGVLVAGVIIAVLTGLIAVVFKSPHQKVVLAGTVCNTIMVDRYNSTMTGYYGDDRAGGLTALNTLSDEIEKRAGAAQDASCLFIRYRVALLNNQYATAKDNLDKLSDQVSAGNSADTRLDGLTSLASMRRSLTAIDPNVKDPDD